MNPRTLLPHTRIVGRRHDYLTEICAAKRVLHLGCVDAGLLQERMSSGAHLHQRLAGATQHLVGLDIDESGIEEMRRAGFENLLVGDVSDRATFDVLDPSSFDIVLASEVVEHLADPGIFLRSLRSWLDGSDTRLVVTVPNAFRIATLLELWDGVELVHPDHNYWFSFVTLRNVLTKAGFVVDEISVYTNETVGLRHGSLKRLPRRLLARTLLRRNPFWGDGLVAIARPAAA